MLAPLLFGALTAVACAHSVLAGCIWAARMPTTSAIVIISGDVCKGARAVAWAYWAVACEESDAWLCQ